MLHCTTPLPGWQPNAGSYLSQESGAEAGWLMFRYLCAPIAGMKLPRRWNHIRAQDLYFWVTDSLACNAIDMVHITSGDSLIAII